MKDTQLEAVVRDLTKVHCTKSQARELVQSYTNQKVREAKKAEKKRLYEKLKYHGYTPQAELLLDIDEDVTTQDPKKNNNHYQES